jgi:hypothetical protein
MLLVWNGPALPTENSPNASTVIISFTGSFCREIGMDRWFADYERKSEHFAGHGERFTIHGLESPEEARRRCEQHANTIVLTKGL